MIKTIYFFKLKTILKKEDQFYFIFQLNYVGIYFAMTVWAIGVHWMQKKPLNSKLLLQTREIDLFAYPTLTKRPARDRLARLWMTTNENVILYDLEHIGIMKLIEHIIKSDMYSLFCLIIW